jgi:hypothetical protein
MFLDQENYIYIHPDFPGTRMVEGSVEFGPAAYEGSFNFGYLRTALGLPLTYLYRSGNDVGFGMNITAGYKYTWAAIGVGLGLDIISRTLFVPSPRYGETEFILYYDWKDFSLVLDITAYGAFESALINPELRYRLGSFIYKLGADISGLGTYPAFSPYLGFEWSY